MTVGICDKDEAMTLENVSVEVGADNVARVVPSAVVMPLTELDEEDEVLVGMTIVMTVLT